VRALRSKNQLTPPGDGVKQLIFKQLKIFYYTFPVS
jgi:hypothetical protein